MTAPQPPASGFSAPCAHCATTSEDCGDMLGCCTACESTGGCTHAPPVVQPPATGDVEAQRGLEDWLIDNHWPNAYDLSHAILASDWLAAYVQAARDDERARVLGEVEALADEWERAEQGAKFSPRARAAGNLRDFVREARGGAR